MRSLLLGGLAMAAGCALIWWRSDRVASPRLERPQVVTFEASIARIESRAAKGDLRLTLVPVGTDLPPLVRVSMPEKDAPDGLGNGADIRLKARLQPPPPMALPGSHDFSRDAWFQGIGGVGRAIGPVAIVEPSPGGGLDELRDRLGRHIRKQLPGASGGIATALATGDQAAVGKEDAEAMRRSGLAHLLSVSGLHIAAVVGAAMLLALKLLALSERLALRLNLVLVAAGVGAIAGVAYTLLTGMQVPTVRACIAALLVLGGIALGRDALSLRLVAVGALVVLLFRPEAIAGASFQMSFAAVTAIIALHHWGPVRGWLGPREEVWPMRLARGLFGLLLTGLAVEIALMPFALYHFHRAGLYGVAANMVAIPLTTFVIMPLEAGALMLDTVGLGGLLWAATGWTIEAMLDLAHMVGSAEGRGCDASNHAALGVRADGWRRALAMPVDDAYPSMGHGAIRHRSARRGDGSRAQPSGNRRRATSGAGSRRWRAGAAAQQERRLCPRPDERGFGLRRRSAGAGDAALRPLQPRRLCRRYRRGRRCLAPACHPQPQPDRLDRAYRACADADIVVADRWLPKGCTPRWLKLDRKALETTGGVAIFLGEQPEVKSVTGRIGDHPWR